ncbi:MAG: hypothetical protein QXQ94_08850 [Candidatus Bathyarchaeia archaeon]
MSQRKMLYAEAEGSYTDILYLHILSEKVFPENDGVVKEVQVGGKKSFVRVDLVSRYGQPERYFGIEVKYWPGAFEQGFKQADRIKGNVHAVFLGIPAEDVPVAQEVRGRRFRDIGVLPVSRIFPTKVAAVKASLNANPDQNALNQLSKHFDDLLYGKEYSETYYSKIWDVIKSKLTKRRKFAFFILFLSQTEVYSKQKFLSQQKVREFGIKLSEALNLQIKHPDWACWELYHLGIVEYVRIGVRNNFFRLNPWLIVTVKDTIKDYFKNEIIQSQNVVQQIHREIIDKRSNVIHDYIG